jgi:perosamine synthetase
VGTYGDAAVFAFYPNKQMTTGEGGMIVTDNHEIAKLCRSMRNQGRDEDCTWLRHSRLGFNYRLSELHSALGVAQLNRIEQLLHERERVAEMYRRALCDIPHLTLPKEIEGSKRSWFVYVIQLNAANPRVLRDRVMRKLRERGIETQAYFPSIHKQPYIARAAKAPLGSLYRSENASDQCLALPFFPGLTSEEVEHVSGAIAQILEDELGLSATAARTFVEVPGN